jgi:AcrR family transcriptional regulator
VTEVRERLVTAAYELFSRNGVQAVGVDAIIERSGVARQTLYRHFGSKQELVLAFLERREEVWTYGWLAAEVKRRARDPRRRLLAIFDVFDEWFRAPDFEGCSFINVMLEHPGADHRLHQAAAGYRRESARSSRTRPTRASLIPRPSPASNILMKGSIVAADEGDVDAARRAKRIGRVLLPRRLAPRAEHRRLRRDR